MKYFSEGEFTCKCGCGRGTFSDMDSDMLTMLDDARDKAGIPFYITSGFRCPAWNIIVGGKKQSAHMRGYAVDINCQYSRERFKILNALIKAGFVRIGIAKTFIHADADPSLDPEVAWLY